MCGDVNVKGRMDVVSLSLRTLMMDQRINFVAYVVSEPIARPHQIKCH